MQIYLVGGAVRDELLGIEVKDRDWVVIGSTPEDMAALGYKAVGKEFPVFIHPDSGEEYALARTERKSGPGYKGFVFNTSDDITLEQDLERRDITINAIARDENGDLIDPFNGRNDLENKVIRHVSDAFVEDPLRVLRVARFAAQFDFLIAAETLALLTEISATDELEALVPERIWVETEKALQTLTPRRYFEVLRECNALSVLFPEIERFRGTRTGSASFPEDYDCRRATLMVLARPANLMRHPGGTFRRPGALHLAKGPPNCRSGKIWLAWPPLEGSTAERTPREWATGLVQPRQWTACATNGTGNSNRVSRPFNCHRIDELSPKVVVGKLEGLDAFRRPERFDKFLLACEADARGRKGKERQDYPQAGMFRKYREACLSVDTKSLDIKDLKGAQIAERIRLQRIRAVKQVKMQEAV